MKCSKCGAEVTGTGKFCGKCGAEVSDTPAKAMTSAEKGQEKDTAVSQNQQSERKRTPTKLFGVIFSILAVILIVVLWAIFKYMALIPIILLLIMIAIFIISRKILQKRKARNSQGITQCTLADKEINRLTQYFVSRDEKYISSLGNGYIMNYLINGSLSKGFAVISNRRVYFRGSCFSGRGKSLVKTNEERTVDIKDVTGSGFIYRRYIGILLGLFTALAALLSGIWGTGRVMLEKWEETRYYQEQADKLQKVIDQIDGSEESINSIQEQIAVYQTDMNELQTRLSELRALQAQEISETAKESIVISELYDTEINTAYEAYLYELNSIFRYSDLYYLLCDLYDKIGVDFDYDYDYYYEFQYFNPYAYEDYIDGNNLASFKNDRDIYFAIPAFFYSSITGTRLAIIELAYLSANYDGQYGISLLYDYDYDLLKSQSSETREKLLSRASSEETEACRLAYNRFIEKVAPAYLNSETNPTLAEIVLNYIAVHPDASFVDRMGISGITTEYDSEINELITAVQSQTDSISALKTEIAYLLQMQIKLNVAKENAFSSFSPLSFVAAAAGLLITFFIACFLVFLDYLRKRKTLFRIEYAGGSIAFDVSFYAKAEIDDFQKQLRRTKDLAEESASKRTVTEPLVQSPVQTTAQNSVPDDLRKYADLLKEGLISQEEYDAMKKKILGL